MISSILLGVTADESFALEAKALGGTYFLAKKYRVKSPITILFSGFLQVNPSSDPEELTLIASDLKTNTKRTNIGLE